LELLQLVSFYHVARLGSVSKASEVVCRTQSAVSQQIKALEDEIGCQLFHRIGKRKLVPTEEGMRLQKFAQNILSEMDRALDDIHAIGGGSRGRVSVSAPFTTCFQILPAILKRFADRFPDVCLSVFDRPQDAAVAMVRDGEADFALALESVVPRGLRSIPWKRVLPVLMVPRGHALVGRKGISIKDIAEQRLILPPAYRRHPGRLFLEKAAQEAALTLNVVIESSNVELSSRWVEKGLGVSFATIVDDDSLLEGRDMHFVPLDHLLPSENLAVAIRDGDSLRGVRKQFLEILLAT
jgi:DNA-binding transcriptional LysR family regulator